MMEARVTTQTVRATVMNRAARPNSGGFSSGRAAVFGRTSPSRMPPVIRTGLPTREPVSRTRSLKCSPRLSGTRGSRIRDPLPRSPSDGVKWSMRWSAPGEWVTAMPRTRRSVNSTTSPWSCPSGPV